MQKSTYFQTGRGDKQNCGKERLINEKGERKQKVITPQILILIDVHKMCQAKTS